MTYFLVNTAEAWILKLDSWILALNQHQTWLMIQKLRETSGTNKIVLEKSDTTQQSFQKCPYSPAVGYISILD